MATVMWAGWLSRRNTNPFFWEKWGAGGYQSFLWLMRPNCVALSYIVSSKPKLESFSKKSNKVELFLSSVSIKLDGFKILEVRRPIINFLSLVLGVLSDATSGHIRKSPWLSQTLKRKLWIQTKTKKLWLPGSDACVCANESWSYYGYKRDMIWASSASRIYRNDLQTSRWPAGLGRLAWVWKIKSM